MNTSVFVETEKHEKFSLPTIVYDIILLSLLIIIDMTCTFAGIWFICMEGGLISCKKKSAAREALVKRVKLDSPDCNVGLHSFRSGGATTAANANVKERCLKRHGRWKSDSSKDRYIVDSTHNRLKVLGL
jgi:hypothetical protein